LKIKKEDARKFVVKKQCFQFPQSDVSREQVFRVLKALGCVQIDTISVVERSHYLAFWSRLGNYRKKLLDQLLYPDRRVFEYWAPAASIIPIEYYRYFLHAMKERRKEMHIKAKRWLKEDASLLGTVLHEIKRNEPLCPRTSSMRANKKGNKKEDGGTGSLKNLFWSFFTMQES
jgi:uncharacterized protein YcaQ